MAKVRAWSSRRKIVDQVAKEGEAVKAAKTPEELENAAGATLDL